MVRCGDIALVKKVRGFKVLQEAICWWLNSEYSHVEPILDSNGNSVDFQMGWTAKGGISGNRSSNVGKYFNGEWRVTILRPNFLVDETAFTESLISRVGTKYALLDYIGFLTNKPISSQGKYHCGSGTLKAYQDSGVLRRHNGKFCSPQSFQEYYVSGLFNEVWSSGCAKVEDWERGVI